MPIPIKLKASPTVEELREAIRLAVFNAGSGKAYARQIGISQSLLSQVLDPDGNRSIPTAILDDLGVERVVMTTYRRKESANAD